MSDTPRTDTNAIKLTMQGGRVEYVVDADVARELERELAANTAQMIAWGETTKRQAAMLNDAAVALGKEHGMGFNIVMFCREAAAEIDSLRAEIGRITSKGTGIDGIDTES